MLRCYRCDRSYATAHRTRCACGEPLWFDDVPPDAEIDDGVFGLARYLDFLPVDSISGLGEGAGRTTLYRPTGLADWAGCDLALLDETTNPTGSFKDRGSAVGVAAAMETGVEAVGTVSHGNMAMSMAATAASVGLDCHVFVPADIPPERLGYIGQYGPTVVAVEGDYGQLYRESLTRSADRSIAFVNSDSPTRIAGQGTAAMDIVEGFDFVGPDAIVLPASSGGHASGVWRGLQDLERAGYLDSLPTLFLVQAAACDPIASAFRSGDETVTSQVAGDTIAYSIANGDPPSGNRALAAVRTTGGVVTAVTDDEIRETQARLATGAGISAEPSAATTLAGIRRLTESGHLDADTTVAGIITGTGFTEPPPADLPEPTEIELSGFPAYLDTALS